TTPTIWCSTSVRRPASRRRWIDETRDTPLGRVAPAPDLRGHGLQDYHEVAVGALRRHRGVERLLRGVVRHHLEDRTGLARRAVAAARDGEAAAASPRT